MGGTRQPWLVARLGEGHSNFKPLLSCSYIPSPGKDFGSKLRIGTNLKPVSRKQSIVVINLALATPATSLAPNRIGAAFPLDSLTTWRGVGGTCYMGNSRSSIAPCPGLHPSHPRLSGEDTPAPPRVQKKKHGKQQSTGSKSLLNCRRARRQLFPTVRGII